MKYFGLGIDGVMYDLCDCGDFDAAEESARDIGVDMIWIADEPTAIQWSDRILISLFDVNIQDIVDFSEEG